MKDYLVFHLYGPLSSFGDTAVGEYRPVLGHPSKSGVIGLIAASLGISRDHEDEIMELSNDLKYAVLILSSGELMRDYHTIQVPSSSSLKKYPAVTRRDELNRKDVNTILSFRDYRMDGYYRVAVWSRSGRFELKSIEEGLSRPRYTPYLGRKSCPVALPMQPKIVTAVHVQEALINNTNMLEDIMKGVFPGQDSQNKGIFTIVTDDEQEANASSSKTRVNWRKDRLISRKNWQYGDRREFIVTVEGSHVL